MKCNGPPVKYHAADRMQRASHTDPIWSKRFMVIALYKRSIAWQLCIWMTLIMFNNCSPSSLSICLYAPKDCHQKWFLKLIRIWNSIIDGQKQVKITDTILYCISLMIYYLQRTLHRRWLRHVHPILRNMYRVARPQRRSHGKNRKRSIYRVTSWQTRYLTILEINSQWARPAWCTNLETVRRIWQLVLLMSRLHKVWIMCFMMTSGEGG